MKKNLLVFCVFILALPAFGQSSLIKQIDNPLLHNALALQERGAVILQTNFDFQNFPMTQPIDVVDSTGTLLRRHKGNYRLGQSIRARVGILTNLEAQVGLTHNAGRQVFEDARGETYRTIQRTWINWTIGGRYSHYIPEQRLSVGIQLSLIGQLSPIDYLVSTEGVNASILLGKEFNEKHQLTGGVGINSHYGDEIPLSLLYMYTPSEQTGIYSKAFYNWMISSISNGILRRIDLGLGAYYAPLDNLRIDLAWQYMWHNYPYNNFGDSFELNLAVAAGF